MQVKAKQSGVAAGGGLTGFDPAIVQRAVDDICESAPFRSTRQCQDLLRYVVLHSLSGQDQYLRERVIGAEVFKRNPDYDPGEDPVVRNRAAEVRKRLAQYYQSANGQAEVYIEIPSGSYRAMFERLQPSKSERTSEPSTSSALAMFTSPEIATPVTIPEPVLPAYAPEPSVVPASRVEGTDSARRVPVWKWVVAVSLSVALFSAPLLWKLTHAADTAFTRFWAPLLDGPKPVLICMGTNAVYRLSNRFLAQYFQEHPEQNTGAEFYVDWKPGQQLDTQDIKRAWNSFVALGDVSASSDLVATLTRNHKAFQQRFPPDVSFSELQNSASILVGGFNNSMAMTVTKDLRYKFTPNNRIEDMQGKSGPWMIHAALDSHDTEDYAIVYRLLDSKTGKPVLGVAGIGQYGTQAAAAFVSSPEMLSQFAAAAPSGWEKKNIQLVLHVKIIDFRPIRTEIVASYYW